VTQVTGTEDTSSDTESADTADETTGDAEETEETEESEETDDGISVIESDKGTIWFVPITGLAQGKTQFAQIIGQESCYVDFQMKDASDTVLYAWEFCGADVTVAEDMIFSIESSTDAFEGCSYGSSTDTLYLAFDQEGDFVGNTSVFMQVDAYFSEDDLLNLYQYDAEADEVMLLQEGLELASGYVTMELAADEGGQLILTTQTLENIVTEDAGSEEDEELSVDEVTDTGATSSSHKGVTAAVILIIIILVILACVLVLRKRRKNISAAETGEGEMESLAETEKADAPDDTETADSAKGSDDTETANAADGSDEADMPEDTENSGDAEKRDDSTV